MLAAAQCQRCRFPRVPLLFVPNLCLTRAHSSAFQRTPAYVAVGHFSSGRKQLRVLTRTVI